MVTGGVCGASIRRHCPSHGLRTKPGEKKQKLEECGVTTARSEALCTQKGVMGPTADVDPMGH